jgi:lauroyl/myristoyl acyltransferase
VLRAKGAALSLASRKRKRVAVALRRAFGEKSPAARRRIARRHFQYVQVNKLARLRSSACAPACGVDGLGHLDAALEGRCGAVLISAHIGYGRLIKPILAARGYAVSVIGFTGAGYSVPPRYTRAGGFVRSRLLRLPSIGRRGIDECDIEAGINLRPALEALRRNEVLLFAADGLGAVSRHSVTVLGRPLQLTLGAVSLCRATGAALLPVFAVDSGRAGVGIRAEIAPALVISEALPAHAPLDEFGRQLTDRIRRHPELWCWSNRHLEAHERGATADENWRADARQRAHAAVP